MVSLDIVGLRDRVSCITRGSQLKSPPVSEPPFSVSPMQCHTGSHTPGIFHPVPRPLPASQSNPPPLRDRGFQVPRGAAWWVHLFDRTLRDVHPHDARGTASH